MTCRSHGSTRQNLRLPSEVPIDGKTAPPFRWRSGLRDIIYGGRRLRLALVRDITERLEAEEALRQSELRYRTLVVAAPFGISIIGKNGRYKYLNPKFEEMFGYTLDDIPTGREWFAKAFPDSSYRRNGNCRLERGI